MSALCGFYLCAFSSVRFGAEHTFMRLLLLEITPALPQLVSIPPPLNGSRPASIFSPATWHIRLKWPLMCAQLHALSFSRLNADLSGWFHRPPHASGIQSPTRPTQFSPCWIAAHIPKTGCCHNGAERRY